MQKGQIVSVGYLLKVAYMHGGEGGVEEAIITGAEQDFARLGMSSNSVSELMDVIVAYNPSFSK